MEEGPHSFLQVLIKREAWLGPFSSHPDVSEVYQFWHCKDQTCGWWTTFFTFHLSSRQALSMWIMNSEFQMNLNQFLSHSLFGVRRVSLKGMRASSFFFSCSWQIARACLRLCGGKLACPKEKAYTTEGVQCGGLDTWLWDPKSPGFQSHLCLWDFRPVTWNLEAFPFLMWMIISMPPDYCKD